MSEVRMAFPDTWEEFEQQYGFDDTEEIYTNGSRLIQTFRVRQWLEHLQAVPVKRGRWIPTHENRPFSHPYSITYVCSECGNSIYTLMGMPQVTEYCSKCGARMDAEREEE